MTLKQIDKSIWMLEKEGRMQVPALIFANNNLIKNIRKDRTLEQLRNVASLDGIVKHAMVMPDAHEGYGFPIGGVAAFDAEEGIVSPGGIGYDINCGVRLIKTPLRIEDVREKIRELADKLFVNVPSGVGSTGKLKMSSEQLDEVARRGAEWAVENGYGWKEDLEHTEEYGRMDGDPSVVSSKAKKRGRNQLGTLGAGNHFLEIQVVDKVMSEKAKQFGLEEGQVVVMVHCGSRGYGHQICSDHLDSLLSFARRRNLWLPDKELVYAPLNTEEAQNYLKAMQCAVNFAFANRQIIMHWVRETFSEMFGSNVADEMHLLYDVAHNIAKFEEHVVDGRKRKLIVHRKGATRAFPAGREELPPTYRSVGQPVIIPGSMGTASYVLCGEEKGLELSFGSTCHGSGRVMSRGQAIRTYRGENIRKELWEKQHIYVRATSPKVIAEEAPTAYKNVDDVVQSVADAGISSVVAKLKPLAVVKG